MMNSCRAGRKKTCLKAPLLVRGGVKLGFTLVETVVGVVLFVTVSVAFMALFAGGAAEGGKALQYRQAVTLAELMLAEVFATGQWNELPSDYALPARHVPLRLATVGPEEGARSQFDDIDDYNGFVMSPPTTREGAAMDASLAGFRVGVAVRFVTAGLQPSGSPTNLKEVVVTVSWPGSGALSGGQTQLRRVACNY